MAAAYQSLEAGNLAPVELEDLLLGHFVVRWRPMLRVLVFVKLHLRLHILALF